MLQGYVPQEGPAGVFGERNEQGHLSFQVAITKASSLSCRDLTQGA